LVDITRHRGPQFGRLAPNILMAQGFSGHGVALAGLAGRVLAEAAMGQASRFDVFARIPHARFPGGRAFRVPALLLATSYFRLRDML
jgi:gamma-glutamylputrescine oxidase